MSVTTLFALGDLVVTPGAFEAMERNDDSGALILVQHATGNWGELCDEDKQLNDQAVMNGDRILSAYHLEDGTEIWIVTESDRSVTTFLLPEEY